MKKFLWCLLALALPVGAAEIGSWTCEEVAASATDQTLGARGSTRDYLDHCVVQVVTSGATGTFGIEDGSNTAFDNIPGVPASTPIGAYEIRVESRATTVDGWEVTTGAAATASPRSAPRRASR